MKKILALLLALTLVFALCACGAKTETPAAGEPAPAEEPEAPAEEPAAEEPEAPVEEPAAEAGPVQNDGFEKFDQIKIGMTEDEVTAILGEPARVDKAYHYYNVVVNGCDLEVEVWINTTTGQVTYKYGDFTKSECIPAFADDATDLSAVTALENEELADYEACAEAFKTAGYLISEDEDGRKDYLWVRADGGFMTVSFGADGAVRSYRGYL